MTGTKEALSLDGWRDWETAARLAIDEKTKPLGALGRLEEWAVRLACIQQTLMPRVEKARVVVFAADHGVACEGVSAFPACVTAEMMRNFDRGGAAINVLTRTNGIEIEVVDTGVDADLHGLSSIVHTPVRRGTRNMVDEPAMTDAECEEAIKVGRAAARRAVRDGIDTLGLGEMGIGSTTAAAALLSALTGATPDATVGRGTGIDDRQLEHKRSVVARAVARHLHLDATSALAALGGLEIASIAGAAIEAASHRIAIVADGFISTVGILAAARI